MVPVADVTSADIFVSAAGYESRATFASHAIRPSQSRIALGFDGDRGPQRVRNDEVFSALGFTITTMDGGDAVSPRKLLRERLTDVAPGATVAIDYSSMTRAWTWGLIAECWQQFETGQIGALQLCYSPATFAPPPATLPPPRAIGPVQGVAPRLRQPIERVALLVGLGYETERALGLFEYLDPAVARFFYADPGSAPEYLAPMRKANSSLFNRAGPESLVAYPLHDWPATIAILNGICSYYRQSHRVLCVPMGPKPFAALTCLLALEHGDILLWRVSSTGDADELDRFPRGDVLCAEIRVVQEEGSHNNVIA